MSESLERIGLLVEMSAVAIEVCTYMTEMNMAMQHLGVAIPELVIVQIVGMYQIDPFVLHLLLARRTLAGWLHGKYHSQHQQTEDDKQISLHAKAVANYSLFTHHFSLLSDPAFIFKLAVTIALVDTHISRLDAVDHPLMELFLTTLFKYHVLQELEVFSNSSLMTLRTTLQLDDSTHRFTTFIDHFERFRYLADL